MEKEKDNLPVEKDNLPTEKEKESYNKMLVQLKHDSEFEKLLRKANTYSQSDLVPEMYRMVKGKEKKCIANCVIALQIAERIGADELMVMQNLFIIQGKPSWSSTFIISALNTCGRFSPLRFDMKGEGAQMSCRAWARDLATNDRIDGPVVSMAMAKDEGWISKSGSKWKTMPELMIRYRAAAFFGRLYAPEILNGMRTVEENHDIVDDFDGVTIDAETVPEQPGSSAEDVLKKMETQEKKPASKKDPKAKKTEF